MKTHLFLLLVCTIFVGTFIGGDSKQLGHKSNHGPSSKHIGHKSKRGPISSKHSGSRAKHGSKSKHGQSREGDDDSQYKFETTGDRSCGTGVPLRSITDKDSLRVDPDSGHPYTSGVFEVTEELPNNTMVDLYYIKCNEDFSDCDTDYDSEWDINFCERLENPTSNLRYPWEPFLKVTEGIGLPTTCSDIKVGNYTYTDEDLYSEKFVEMFKETGHEYWKGEMLWHDGYKLFYCQELPVHIYKEE